MSHSLIRTPARKLLDARQDHARCLRLAAWYRGQFTQGDASMRDRHAWALGQTALDAADKIIAALDRLDGSDAPQGIEAATAPSPAAASAPLAQIIRLGDLGDFRTAIPRPRAAREEAPITPSPEPNAEAEAIAARTALDDAESFATGIARPRLREEAAATEIRVPFPPLPWGGAGNVVAAAGCAVLALGDARVMPTTLPAASLGLSQTRLRTIEELLLSRFHALFAA